MKFYEKLLVLASHGVGRISVNPQTMRDSVLNAIGRKHSARDILDAIATVRKFPNFSVNMDLIAGLYNDDYEGFRDSLIKILELSPENITVHTLSRKRGAALVSEGLLLPDAAEVGKMLDFANRSLNEAGYSPYYLYRQKFMSGNFENIGWTSSGFHNLYNICIMEELCSIISLGAGASTKLVSGNGRMERFINAKYPTEYIGGVDKICSEKERIISHYGV